MIKIASKNWIINVAGKECLSVQFGLKIKVEYFNNCLTAQITEMPEYLKNIYRSKRRNELTHQLIIVQGLKRYAVALPSKCYKKSIVEDFQALKTNEENNENNNEKNIIKIADNGWIIDLVNKEGFDVQYGLKIKVEFVNDCLTAKIFKISKDFRNERIPKKEKDILKQCKIVQGLDIYTEALRSSLVDNKRKRPKSTPKPTRFPDLPPISESMIKLLSKQGFKPISSPSLRKTLKYNTLPELPPISENMKKLLSKQGFKPLSKPTPKPPPKNKKNK